MHSGLRERCFMIQVAVNIWLEMLFIVCPPFPGTELIPHFNSRHLRPSPPSRFEHITSGQECFASPGKLCLFFLCKALQGHVTERNTVSFFFLYTKTSGHHDNLVAVISVKYNMGLREIIPLN